MIMFPKAFCGRAFRGYVPPLEPNQEQCPHSLHKVELVPSSGWTFPGLSHVSDPVCGLHEQDLMLQLLRGG